MENTGYVALSLQTALWRRMDVVANNLANMNTTAYKDQQEMFSEYVVQSKGSGLKPTPISFVHDVATLRDTAPGTLEKTDNPLDLAVNGKGYFVIDTPQGQRYTRNGHFRLDSTGQMVTDNGYPVLDDRGQPFFFAPTDTNIQIARDGTVSSNNGKIGRIRLVDFDDEQDMKAEGNGLYSTTQQPFNVVSPDVIQGSLEESNVQPIREMTRMITIQRTYEMANQLIKQENQRQMTMLQVLSRVA